MEKKEFMEKYSELMAAAAFADACGPIAEIEILEDSGAEPTDKLVATISRPAPAM